MHKKRVEANKIKVVTPVYKREELTKIFLKQLERFKSYGIDSVVVGSEGEDYAIQFPNQPLGEKWNFGLQQAKDCDYIIMLDSDDFIPNSEIERLIELSKQNYDYIAYGQIYFYNGRLLYWSGYPEHYRKHIPAGALQMVSKRLLKIFDYNLFSPVNRSLDADLHSKLKNIDIKSHVINDGILVDVKYSNNLTDLNRVRRLKK